jgi:hypothetical protein
MKWHENRHSSPLSQRRKTPFECCENLEEDCAEEWLRCCTSDIAFDIGLMTRIASLMTPESPEWIRHTASWYTVKVLHETTYGKPAENGTWGA